MEKNKSKKLKIIVIAEVCAVVIIAGVVGGIIYHNKSKAKKLPADATASVTQSGVISGEQTGSVTDPSDIEGSTSDESTTIDGITTTLQNPNSNSSVPANNSSSGKNNSSSNNNQQSSGGNSNNGSGNSQGNNSGTTTTESFLDQVARYRNNTKKFYNKIGVAGSEAGILGYYYDEESDCFRTKGGIDGKSWQSHFGFGEIYDSGAAVAVMYYDTARVKFKYNNRDWMVQLWKGQYGACFMGAEIGLYVKNGGTVSGLLSLAKSDGYDCATDPNDQLQMSMRLVDTLNGKEEQLFYIKPGSYWWLTGFQFGKLKNLADRSELTAYCTITFKDADMCNAFVAAFENTNIEDQAGKVLKRGYFVNGSTFTVSGNTVSFTW